MSSQETWLATMRRGPGPGAPKRRRRTRSTAQSQRCRPTEAFESVPPAGAAGKRGERRGDARRKPRRPAGPRRRGSSCQVAAHHQRGGRLAVGLLVIALPLADPLRSRSARRAPAPPTLCSSTSRNRRAAPAAASWLICARRRSRPTPARRSAGSTAMVRISASSAASRDKREAAHARARGIERRRADIGGVEDHVFQLRAAPGIGKAGGMDARAIRRHRRAQGPHRRRRGTAPGKTRHGSTRATESSRAGLASGGLI